MNRITVSRSLLLRVPKGEMIGRETKFGAINDPLDGFSQLPVCGCDCFVCKPQMDSKYNDVDDEAMMTKAFRTNVASYSSLEDSDSYSCRFKLNKWRLYTNLRIPGLMFLLALCGRPPRFNISDGCFYKDMPDTLVLEGLFHRIGRESGVMLDTLTGEGSFLTSAARDMSDTLAMALKRKSTYISAFHESQTK